MRFFEQSSQNDKNLKEGINNKFPLQGRGVKQEKESLRPSPEVLSETLTQNAQNDICAVISGEYPQLQSLAQKENPPKSPFTKGGKKTAFTLAEVLVTMGVIGIVAAMTMPMLARNYNFYIRQQQFKKAYAELSIAVQKTQIDLGEGIRCYQRYSSTRSLVENLKTDCYFFYTELVKNLNLLKTCENNPKKGKCISEDYRGADLAYAEMQTGGDKEAAKQMFIDRGCSGYLDSNLPQMTVFVTNSGYSIMPYGAMNVQNYLSSAIVVDINALKGPNKWGHDIFIFRLEKKKQYDSIFIVTPNESCHAIDFGGYYTKNFFNYLYGQNAEL